MIKGFRQIASLTALSRVFGLVRDMSFSYFFGAGGLMDTWVIAFKIPNLSRRLFGEGAASASLIPVYSQQLHDDPEKAKALANTVTTLVFVGLAGLVLIGWAGIFLYRAFFAENTETRLMLSLSATMLPYMIMVCTVAILAGILNVHRHFAVPAAAPIVLNIFIIVATISSGLFFDIQPSGQVFMIAIAVLLAGLVQLAMQFYPLHTSGISIRPAWQVRSEALRKIFILMGPMILGLTVTQINTLTDDLIAWCLSGSIEKGDFFVMFGRQIQFPFHRGSVSYLYFSQRLYQFPLGVLGISLATAIFPVMSSDAAKKDFTALTKTISRGIRSAVFVAIPATAGLILVARPLVAVILQRGKFTAADTMTTAWTLSFYAVGLLGFFSQQITARAFYSMQDSKTPMRSAVLAVFVNVVLNLTLIWFMGTAGLALSTALCSYLQVVILTSILRKRFGSSVVAGLRLVLLKAIAATAAMSVLGFVILYLMRNLPISLFFDVLRLAVVVPVTAGFYILAAKLLRTKEMSLITGKGELDR